VTAATIRRATPADARAIAQVRVDAWRVTYRGMIPDAYLDAMTVDDSAPESGRGSSARSPRRSAPWGATGLLTWVIAQNHGARTFYERLGGKLLVEQPFEGDGMNLVEAGYGWRDLGALAMAGASAATMQQ